MTQASAAMLSAYRAYAVARAIARHGGDEALSSTGNVDAEVAVELAAIAFTQAMPDAVLCPSAEHDFLLAARDVPSEEIFAQRLGKSGGDFGTNFGGREIAFARMARVLSTSALPSNHMTHATGYAWAMRVRGEASAVLTTMPSWVAETGDFHSAVNFAGAVKAPCIFLVLPCRRTAPSAIASVADKTVGYGVDSVRVRVSDFAMLTQIAEEAFSRAALERKPLLVELTSGESSPDIAAELFPSRAEHFAFLETIEVEVRAAHQRALLRPNATAAQAQQAVFAQ